MGRKRWETMVKTGGNRRLRDCGAKEGSGGQGGALKAGEGSDADGGTGGRHHEGDSVLQHS